MLCGVGGRGGSQWWGGCVRLVCLTMVVGESVIQVGRLAVQSIGGGMEKMWFERSKGICVPTGELRLLPWDVRTKQFSNVMYCSDRTFTLLPPCCGRGANCPHLLLTAWPRQWPNGDALDIGALLPIPAAFATLLQTQLR